MTQERRRLLSWGGKKAGCPVRSGPFPRLIYYVQRLVVFIFFSLKFLYFDCKEYLVPAKKSRPLEWIAVNKEKRKNYLYLLLRRRWRLLCVVVFFTRFVFSSLYNTKVRTKIHQSLLSLDLRLVLQISTKKVRHKTCFCRIFRGPKAFQKLMQDISKMFDVWRKFVSGCMSFSTNNDVNGLDVRGEGNQWGLNLYCDTWVWMLSVDFFCHYGKTLFVLAVMVFITKCDHKIPSPLESIYQGWKDEEWMVVLWCFNLHHRF